MPRALSLKVVGAPYDNADGSNRRFEIALCDPGEPVELRPEPKNKHDEHAVGVWSARGVQIGYLPSERAVYVKKMMRDGHDLTAIFQEATAWGAVIRLGVDQRPTLPAPQRIASDPVDDDGFYPDYIPPDD